MVEQLLLAGGGQAEDEVKEVMEFYGSDFEKIHSCLSFVCSVQTISLRKELAFMTFCVL